MQHFAPPLSAVGSVPAFTPVPRRQRADGWTAERQRSFIAALALTGSVTASAQRVGMSREGAYQLRLHPLAESFRAAWAAALAQGVHGLVDIALERATQGVAVPVFYKGEQCGERRVYNDRLLMFLLKHHLPETYGAAPLHPGTRSPETIAREAAENCPVCAEQRDLAARADDPDGLPTAEETAWIDQIWRRYAAKVREERHYRRTGQVVAADFALRQLTHLELILSCGGRTMEMIDLWTRVPEGPGEPTELFACEVSATLDAMRRKTWADAGEPARPALPLDQRTCPDSAVWGGPNSLERSKARRDAERRIAEAQAEWEAAAREDSWAEWTARHG